MLGRTFGMLQRQVGVLMYKNLVILARNWLSTTVRLLSCAFFMVLMWIIISAMNGARDNRSWVKNLPHPEEIPVAGIPPCSKPDCVALAYAPAPSKAFTPSEGKIMDSEFPVDMPAARREELQRVHAIIKSAMINNRGGALKPSMVKGFTTTRDMEEFILQNANNVKAGVTVESPEAGKTTYTIQANSTALSSQVHELLVPLQVAMTASIARVSSGKEVDLDVSLQEYAHPAALNVDVGASDSDIAPLFIFSALLFPFVMQMSEVANDKETRMRQTLQAVGMLDSAYWISWHLFHLMTSALIALSITVVGLLFGFELFVNIDFGVLFCTFFFFSLAMNGLAFFLSSFLHTSASAMWVGVCTFFVGFVAYVVVSAFGIPWGTWPAASNFYMNCSAAALYDPATELLQPLLPSADPSGKRFIFEDCTAVPADNANYSRQVMYFEDGEAALAPVFALFPPTLLCKTLSDMGVMASNDTGAFGLGMHNVTSYCFHNVTEGTICDADYAVGNVWGIWVGLYILYSLLGIYLDNVLPDIMGVRKPLNYFMLASYWNLERPIIVAGEAENMGASTDEDVLVEEAAVKARIGGSMSDDNSIEVRGMRKTFKRNTPGLGIQDYHAVKCPWFSMKKKSLFALLGPNGAGKTTLINMLTGVLPASAGEALVFDHPVTHPSGLANIRPLIGICPQFDILWNTLTAKEHLQIFCAIKGVPQDSVDVQSLTLLEEVRLSDVADKFAGTFSGGMKRRLSVALSMVGNPSCLFLDEPTTGMDPISRRHVWDVIERAKQDCCIVLTTHSMEEADILGDRVGIMAKGQLRCLGTPMHLKSKFGSGYQITISLQREAARHEIKRIFADTLQVPVAEETAFFMSFHVATQDEIKLPLVFNQLEERKVELGLDNIQIGMSSLEDVFLAIAKSVGFKEGSNGLVEVKTCTGETCDVVAGQTEPFSTPQGHKVRVIWSMDADGNMTPVETIHVSSVVSLEVKVPAGQGPGSSVELDYNGQVHHVEVPIGANGKFITEIEIPAGPSQVQITSQQLGPSTEELESRVKALASSYASQSKAMFQKTLAIQKKRKGTNLCLCACPAVTLTIIFLAQMLIEGLFIQDKMASQRCTYCGPQDDFGKAYCAGMPCSEYFWQVNNRKAQNCKRPKKKNSAKCLAMMGNAEVEAAKAHCEAISKTCGGNGQLACFWPSASEGNGSLGRRCESFSINPDTLEPDLFSPAQPLSFGFSPRNSGLRSEPVIVTSPDSAVTERILDHAYKDPFSEEQMAISSERMLDAMYTLWMLPGLGCGEFGNLTSIGISEIQLPKAFSYEARAAMCKLLQHGLGTDRTCCLDLSTPDAIPTYTDAQGTLTASGQGKAAARDLLARLSDEKMSKEYFGALNANTFECVRPAYTAELESRLPKRRMDLGMEEGLAVYAQAFDLASSVHPKTEGEKEVPWCTAAGSCSTPGARWAQMCDLVDNGWATKKCGAEMKQCSQAFGLSTILSTFPDGPKGGAAKAGLDQTTPCMCRFVAMLRRLAYKELGIIGVNPATGRTAVVGLPRLPGFQAAILAGWVTPRMSITDGAVLRDGNPISLDVSLAASSDVWWNWAPTKRYGQCSCRNKDTNQECLSLFGPGCDENNPKKCQKDRDCQCRMDVWGFDSSTGLWEMSRGNTKCEKTKQKQRLIRNNGYGGFALQVRNCSTQQAAVGLLHKFLNLTGLSFECISMVTHAVPTHRDVDDIVYKGFYNPYAVGDVQGVSAAFAFKEVQASKLQVTMMHNTSQAAFPFGKRGTEVRLHIREDRLLAPLNTLLKGYLAEMLGVDSAMLIALKSFPATAAWGQAPDIGSSFGPFLITTTFLVLLPSIVVTHVQEKVSRIRVMMKMMGLGTSAYWSISYVFWFCIMFVFSMAFMLLANVCASDTGYKIGMFQKISPGIQFVFFLCYSLNVISFAFFLSTLAQSVRVAQVGTILFIVVSVILGLVFETVGGIWNSESVTEVAKTLLTLFPSMGFYRAMVAFQSHDGDQTLQWQDMDGSHPLSACLLVQGIESGIFILLALYVDQVTSSSGYGVRQHPLFCLGFGSRHQAASVEETAKPRSDLPDDVREEMLRVQEMDGKSPAEGDSIILQELEKTYPGGKLAVRPLSLGVSRSECFGMLGPNGAGKTTTINMLTGFTMPTRGTATVEGFSILTHMQQIYSIMGVCPQHDILYDTLSPREHLTFYGNLKNLDKEELSDAIEDALRNVDLLDVIDTPAGTFSGGMKRRLSVAIALIGRPLVCYLDEPSTGLDPANRRLLWDSIKRAKASRTILLTTHSMQEAEGLCDRLSIFVDGQAKCIGAPKSLTMRFSAVYNLVITASPDNQAQVSSIVAQLCPSFQLTYALANTSKYELPVGNVTLENIFARMLQARADGIILGWGVASTTLEDAFIQICSRAEAPSLGTVVTRKCDES